MTYPQTLNFEEDIFKISLMIGEKEELLQFVMSSEFPSRGIILGKIQNEVLHLVSNLNLPTVDEKCMITDTISIFINDTTHFQDLPIAIIVDNFVLSIKMNQIILNLGTWKTVGEVIPEDEKLYSTHFYDGKLEEMIIYIKSNFPELDHSLRQKYLEHIKTFVEGANHPQALGWFNSMNTSYQQLLEKEEQEQKPGAYFNVPGIDPNRSDSDDINSIDLLTYCGMLMEDDKMNPDNKNLLLEQLADIENGKCSQGRTQRMLQPIFFCL
jgi:hypothetical protein